MYYEEKVIDTVHGKVLAYRNEPKGEWVLFTIAQLTDKYEKLRFAAFNLSNSVEDYIEDQAFIDDPLGLLAQEAQQVKNAM